MARIVGAEFCVRARHGFAAILDVWQKTVPQPWRKRPSDNRRHTGGEPLHIQKKLQGPGAAPRSPAAAGETPSRVPNRHPQIAEAPAASAAKALAPPHRGGSQGLSVSSRGKLRTCRRPARRRRPVPRTGPSAPVPPRRGTGCGPWIPHGPSPTPSCAWSVLHTGHTCRGWP